MTDDKTLSDKIKEYGGTWDDFIPVKDVKNFIKERNKLVEYWFGDLYEFAKFKKEFDKLAGKNLI